MSFMPPKYQVRGRTLLTRIPEIPVHVTLVTAGISNFMQFLALTSTRVYRFNGMVPHRDSHDVIMTSPSPLCRLAPPWPCDIFLAAAEARLALASSGLRTSLRCRRRGGPCFVVLSRARAVAKPERPSRASFKEGRFQVPTSMSMTHRPMSEIQTCYTARSVVPTGVAPRRAGGINCTL